MTFFQIYLQAYVVIMIMMTILWISSVILKNVSIVDLFWGIGFILAGGFYFLKAEGLMLRKSILMVMVILWGLRLSAYLAWRNHGRGEDFRYREFRRRYGEKRYWWISFFQTFLLQGTLMWLISAPLGLVTRRRRHLGFFDYTDFIVDHGIYF